MTEHTREDLEAAEKHAGVEWTGEMVQGRRQYRSASLLALETARPKVDGFLAGILHERARKPQVPGDAYCSVCGHCGEVDCCGPKKCKYPTVNAEEVTAIRSVADDAIKERDAALRERDEAREEHLRAGLACAEFENGYTTWHATAKKREAELTQLRAELQRERENAAAAKGDAEEKRYLLEDWSKVMRAQREKITALQNAMKEIDAYGMQFGYDGLGHPANVCSQMARAALQASKEQGGAGA